MPAPPWIFEQAPLPGGLPPFQGEHNAKVLAELGLRNPEIDALRAKGTTIDAIPRWTRQT